MSLSFPPPEQSPDATGSSAPGSGDQPAHIAWTERLEGATALDPVIRAVRPLADALVSDPARSDLLRGTWLGHALHPPLTDVPIGFWTSAVVLDLVGGVGARPAARKLVALGILSAVPTAVTGVAEWSSTGAREQRVGVVHAASNVAALTLFTVSWRAPPPRPHPRRHAPGPPPPRAPRPRRLLPPGPPVA